MRVKKRMKAILVFFVALGLALAFAPFWHTPKARAHSDGHGAALIGAEQVTYNAQAVKENLVEEKKLESSWLRVPRESAKTSKRMLKGREEWVVTFMNEKAKDPAKRTLFVFFNLTGQFIAANHKGE